MSTHTNAGTHVNKYTHKPAVQVSAEVELACFFLLIINSAPSNINIKL